MLKRDHRVVPLYYQVEHVIRQRITNGEYAPGSQIPSENELSREMGVSRVTVREALRELVREDMLVKVQGKGTFVSHHPSTGLPAMKFTGFLEELYDRVQKVSVKDVEVSQVPVPDELRKLLSLAPEESELVRIKRLRYVNDAPYAFTINFLPLEIGRQIREKELYRVPLLWILQEELKIPITRAHETVEAAAADPEVAERLDIPLLSPVMHVKRVMFTDRDRPLELVESYYRADRYQYSVNLIRVKRDGKWAWGHES
jgi:GntR family transcriptional regulator